MGLGYLGKEKKRKLHIFTVMAIPIDIKAIKSKFKCFPIELKKTKNLNQTVETNIYWKIIFHFRIFCDHKFEQINSPPSSVTWYNFLYYILFIYVFYISIYSKTNYCIEFPYNIRTHNFERMITYYYFMFSPPCSVSPVGRCCVCFFLGKFIGFQINYK